jgi:hydrogenase maturation factor
VDQNQTAQALATGKLPPELLRALLASLPAPDPAVVAAGAVGEDAAVIDTGGLELLVAKTDPITFANEDAGRYLLAVNGNDIASMGGEPRWLLVTALLPEGTTRESAAEVLGGLREACVEAGVVLVGGHTEITVGLVRPILVGCLLGTVPRDGLTRTSSARPGDSLVLAGGIAIEGTAILAREHAEELCARGVGLTAITSAADWLRTPGISVLPAARALRGLARALHDPTEGGVITALHEIADASGNGLRVARERIAVLPECAAICEALGLDPLGLLASGALLAAVPPEKVEAALARLAAAGISGARIGEVAAGGRNFADGSAMPVFTRDELARFLESVANR